MRKQKINIHCYLDGLIHHETQGKVVLVDGLFWRDSLT